MNSTSHIEKSKNCSKTWQKLTLSRFVSRKQEEEDYNVDREACAHISFYLVKLDPGTHFLCNANPNHLISSFITALKGLATQSKTQMKMNFIGVETAVKKKLCAILEQLNQKCNQAERVSPSVDDCIVEEEEKDLFTKFLQMQKNPLTDLQEHFERYRNILPVFGFNSEKYDIILIKSYLLPIPVNEQDIEPTVIKEANQFVSLKFGDIQLLNIMNFLGDATSLDSFIKAHKTKETKGLFPYGRFVCPEKMNNR